MALSFFPTVQTAHRSIHLLQAALFLLAFFALQNLSFTQNGYCEFDNVITGDPLYMERIGVNENEMREMMNQNPQAIMNGSVYVIPLVFHVIHLGEPVGVGSNISDAQLLQALQDLNQTFRDTAGNDVQIEFCLAKRDPNGDATTGINRVDGSNVPGYSSAGIQRPQNEFQVKALSIWPNTDYLNVWIVHEIENSPYFLGYGYFPGANAGVDGIVLDDNAAGVSANSKIFAHEAGHFLNLYHTFQGGNQTTCPPNVYCDFQGDQVCDTPPHLLTFTCNENETNACDNSTSNNLFVHNHMGYTDNNCRDEFTHDQVMRMRCALMVLRPSLMNSIGCVLPCSTVVASFLPSATTVNQGGSVVFDNTSTGANSYKWFVEGLEYATTEDLTLTFNNPGFITVCMRATDGNCINSFCKEIEVIQLDICPTPQVIECEYLFNGNLELSTVPNGTTEIYIGHGKVCNWVPRKSTPFFCSDFAYNSIGLNHDDIRKEGIVTETELELVDGETYLLSFEYYVVPATAGADNPTIKVGLAQTAEEGISLPGDYGLLIFWDLPFDDNTLVSNETCHVPNVQYNQHSLCFTYHEGIGRHLYFINTTPGGNSATFFVKNISVQGCDACGSTDCADSVVINAGLDECNLTLSAEITSSYGNPVLCWDFGDGSPIVQGSDVVHQYLFGGEFTVCLTVKCDPETAATFCNPVEIPEGCNNCKALNPVSAVLCEEAEGETETDNYLANFSFEVPKGFGACQEDDLFVWSGDVEIFVTSFEIDDSDPNFDVITVAIVIVPPLGYDFENLGAEGFITLCNEQGERICRTFELDADICDHCLPEVVSQAVCHDPDPFDEEFVYEGSITVLVPPNSTYCGVVSPETGFQVTGLVNNGTNWTISYVIVTSDEDFNHTSAILCFLIGTDRYCIPLTIIATPCINLPTECDYVWAPKTMTCTSVEDGFVVFDFGPMVVFGGAFQICDGGLFGTVDGGIVEVHSAHVQGIQLYFDVTVMIPTASFVSDQIYNMRLYLCDEAGNLVCYLFPLRLICEGEIGGGGSGGRGLGDRSSETFSPFPLSNEYRIHPNPATTKLMVSVRQSDNEINREICLQDNLGRVITFLHLTSDATEIDISAFQPGIYFATIFENGLPVQAEKVIVLR